MLTQCPKLYPHQDIAYAYRDRVDRIISILLDQLYTYKSKRSKNRSFDFYQKLPIRHRQDIGLDDPQAQLKILGRLIVDETRGEDQRFSGSWWTR
jgi:hypothetical protein